MLCSIWCGINCCDGGNAVILTQWLMCGTRAYRLTCQSVAVYSLMHTIGGVIPYHNITAMLGLCTWGVGSGASIYDCLVGNVLTNALILSIQYSTGSDVYCIPSIFSCLRGGVSSCFLSCCKTAGVCNVCTCACVCSLYWQ